MTLQFQMSPSAVPVNASATDITPGDGRIIPVILCGGAGTRLWPLSRKDKPKPFFAMVQDRSLLQAVVAAVSDPARFAPPVIVAAEAHAFLVQQQLSDIGITPQALILEPEGRNTAPAVALAALQIALQDRAAPMLVLPSDHYIAEPQVLVDTVLTGKTLANSGALVTFGITPTRPETGYGYIKAGAPLAVGEGCHLVERFVEKPDADTAAGFLDEGGYSWNSGMFLFTAGRILHAFFRHAPEILDGCVRSWSRRAADGVTIAPDRHVFATVPNQSIDYAIMEHTPHAAVVTAGFRWSDIGSWQALWDVADKDAAGNAVQGRAILEDCRNTYVRGGAAGGPETASGRLVAAVGVEDLVIVDTPDAILVAPRNRSQEIKRVVERLSCADSPEASSHAETERPWGRFRSVTRGDGHQVKHITVRPGARLSRQYHHHRAEHWVVVAGIAEVEIDDRTLTLTTGESCFIPVGAVHRMSNPGDIPLQVIEVQHGDYLGEDDIVRLDDMYGRVETPPPPADQENPDQESPDQAVLDPAPGLAVPDREAVA